MHVSTRFRLLSCGLIPTLLAIAPVATGQARPHADEDGGTYRLKLPVDEVVVTFHAADANGRSVNDLKASEIKIWDNGVPPRRIVAFDAYLNRALAVHILIDTSESMAANLPRAKLIAQWYAKNYFRLGHDVASVLPFAYTTQRSATSTNDSDLLGEIVVGVKPGGLNPLPGTAIFDAIFKECFYASGEPAPAATGRFILLFSDGEDNAGQTTIDEALRACQQSNTSIYALRFLSPGDDNSTGPKTLEELAAKTGGAVFPADNSDADTLNDLRTIDSQMRDQYRLVYNPTNLKHDGAFHEIEIQPPDRVSRVDVRSGYYAPVQ